MSIIPKQENVKDEFSSYLRIMLDNGYFSLYDNGTKIETETLTMPGGSIMSRKANVIDINSRRNPELRYDAQHERSKNVLGERLSAARKQNNLYLKDVSKAVENFGISITVNALSRMELGDTVPNAYQLIALCFVYGIMNIAELCEDYQPEMNEAGMKKLHEYKADLIATGKYAPAPKKVFTAIEYIEMPTAYMGASAGTGLYLEGSDFEMKSYPKNSVPEEADFALHVSGDSMEPTYNNGQTVWVKRCSELSPGDVGIFVCDDEGFIKMYDEQEPDEQYKDEFTDSEGNLHPQPVLISYNPAYEPRMILPGTEFRIVGKVL